MCKYGKNGICRCWKDKEMDYSRTLLFLYLVLAHQIHFICLVILLGEMVPSSTVEAEKVRYTCGL